MDSRPAADAPVSDMEFLKKMEDEHLRLQRQVRMIQADRQNRTMGVHPLFRRQDHLLKTLKKEYINLIKDLKIARSGAHKKKDKKMKIELKNALLYRIKTEMYAEVGTTLMSELDGLLRRDGKNMLLLRKLTNASKGQIESRRYQSENRLVSTENKLEAANLRFNCLQYENKKIRTEIEYMLKDRALFNQAWTKMMNALNKGKKFLTDLFESSTLAYDQRDEWCTKLRSIQEKGKIDQIQQVQEMQELQKAFDHEMKLYHFLAKKGVIRINEQVEQKEEEEKVLAEENRKKEYEHHVKILEEINNYTNEPDIEKIIKTFEQTEQQNFSIYTLLTEYCAENVALQYDLNRIRRDIEDRRDWNEMKEAKRVEKIEKLRAELEEKRRKTSELRSKQEDRTQLLHGTMEKIEGLFKMLDCSLEPFQNLLGHKQPSLRRLDLTLRLITEKIQEYIEIVYYSERSGQKKNDKTTSRLKKYTVRAEPPEPLQAIPLNIAVPADPCPSCVEARWLSRVTDIPEVPFDKEDAERALGVLISDPAFVTSDRIHPLAECRVPHSRLILARRYTATVLDHN